MSSLAFPFLACLMMSVTTVSSLKIPLPAVVFHPDGQCTIRGFLGSCENLDFWAPDKVCKNIECAGRIRGLTGQHRAMSIGRAARGTHCDENKVCYDGDCIDLPRGMNMPVEILEDEHSYKCYLPNSVKPSLWYYG